MELSEYAINDEGSLVYIPKYSQTDSPRTYKVWGIGEWGLIHGVGAYINREQYYRKGHKIHIIDVPSYYDYIKYYNNLNKFRDGFKDD